MLHYQNSDDGPVMLVTTQYGAGYVAHRVRLSGCLASETCSTTAVCATRGEALDILLRNPPILTRESGAPAPQDLRCYRPSLRTETGAA